MSDEQTPLDPAIAEVMRSLDLAVVEWTLDGAFAPLASTPKWFRGTTPWGSLPFLEHFVAEARRYLHDHVGGVLASDSFAVNATDGEELLLRARALKVKQRLILAIEKLEGASDVRPLLRQARQDALEHEQLEDKARALHAPIDAVAKAAASLGNDALNQAVARLQDAATALPAARKRR